MTLRMILLREWLLFRFVFLRDPRAFRRLKALCRLNTRKELKQLKEIVHGAEGLDPAPIVECFCRKKLQILKEHVKEGDIS